MAFSAKARRAALAARRRNNQLRREGKLPAIKHSKSAMSKGNGARLAAVEHILRGRSGRSEAKQPTKEIVAMRLIGLLEKVLQ